MRVLARYTWTLGLVGAALAAGFALRTWLLGGVDERGFQLAMGAAALLVAYAVFARDTVEDAARSRAVRRGSLGAALVVGAAVLAVVSYGLVRSVDVTIDLTRQQVHALTPHTRSVLAALDGEVRVLAFFPHGSALQQRFERLVRGYVDATPHVTLELVDPAREPLRAREHGVEFQAGEVVLVAGDRTERVVGRFDEDALTDAIVRVTSERDHVVCWSEGHGEPDPDDTRGPGGLGSVVVALEGQNYQVLRTNLLRGPVEPVCEALVIARPTVDFLDRELAAVGAWLTAGGRALLLLEPGATPALAELLGRFGVEVGADVVLDPAPEHIPAGLDDPSFLVVPPRAFGDHPITASLPGAVLLGVARSVATTPDAPGVRTRVLLRAGPRSWAQAEPTSEGGAPSDVRDLRGDVPLAVAVEITDPAALDVPGLAAAAPHPGGRLVVVGDGGFASNQGVGFGSNLDLFLNAVAWLVDEEAQLGARPDDTGEQLPITRRGAVLTALMAGVVAPGVALALALLAWWRQRGA